MILEILEGGYGVTVQDAGRRGHADLGIPESGAMDCFALQAANLLAGNKPWRRRAGDPQRRVDTAPGCGLPAGLRRTRVEPAGERQKSCGAGWRCWCGQMIGWR